MGVLIDQLSGVRDRKDCGAGVAHSSDLAEESWVCVAELVVVSGDGVGSGAGSAQSSEVGVGKSGVVIGVVGTGYCACFLGVHVDSVWDSDV